jgi:hypothetical protein
MDIAFEKKLSIFSEAVETSNLLIKLRVYDQVEVIIDLLELSDVFILHLSTSSTLPAWMIRFWEANLVDNNIVNVNLKLGKLDSQSFSFIKR